MLDRIVASVAGTVALATGLACSQAAPQDATLVAKWKEASFTDLEAKTLEGESADLGAHAGKVIVVVNVASQCGFTGQYAGLQKLYETYRDRGLVVLGVPSGDFGGQEYDDPAEIRSFCDRKYKVTFPILEKSSVKAGPKQSELFACLGTKSGELPGWNFGKYVVSRDGKRAQFFASAVAPDSARLVEAIEKALAEPVPAGAKDVNDPKAEGDAKKAPPAAAPTPAA